MRAGFRESTPSSGFKSERQESVSCRLPDFCMIDQKSVRIDVMTFSLCLCRDVKFEAYRRWLTEPSHPLQEQITRFNGVAWQRAFPRQCGHLHRVGRACFGMNSRSSG